MSAVCASGKAVKPGFLAHSVKLKHTSIAEGAARVGGSIQVTGTAANQACKGIRSVRCSRKRIENRESLRCRSCNQNQHCTKDKNDSGFHLHFSRQRPNCTYWRNHIPCATAATQPICGTCGSGGKGDPLTSVKEPLLESIRNT